MDPFSITLGVVTLTTLASKAGIELKKLRSGAAEATNNVNAMLADLKALKTVLDLIEDGFEDLDSRAPLTGHIGSHWSALQTTLGDGCESLQKLESLLVLVNKDVRYLDSARRALRLKEANDQIIMYRQEIQAYRDALQLSFQSVIFFQQCTVAQNTTEILDRSYDLHEDLGRLATNLEVKLTALETILVERQSTDNASISHLKRCARTAETVVESASTALGDDDTINESAATSDVVSEFHWSSYDSAPSNLTLNWVSSLQNEQARSFDTLVRSPDLNSSGTESPSASQPTTTPSTPRINRRPCPSPIHVQPRQTSTGSLTFASPTISSPELGRLADLDSREDLSGDEDTVKDTPIKKRRNFSLSQLLSPRSRSKTTSRKTGPLCKDDLKISGGGQVMMKWTFVGDGASGKTCFLLSTSKGIFSEVYVPTIFENYIADFHVDGVDFKCTLWDTAGQSDFDRVRPTSYAQTDIFCICFSIDYPDSLGNVKDKWFPEISQYKRKTDPVFLLGFKEDLRHDPKTIEELSRLNQTPITTKQGEALAKSIGALKYFECSSIRHQGTKEIFETILSMVLMASPQLKKRYKSGNWRRRAINKLQPSS